MLRADGLGFLGAGSMTGHWRPSFDHIRIFFVLNRPTQSITHSRLSFSNQTICLVASEPLSLAGRRDNRRGGHYLLRLFEHQPGL